MQALFGAIQGSVAAWAYDNAAATLGDRRIPPSWRVPEGIPAAITALFGAMLPPRSPSYADPACGAPAWPPFALDTRAHMLRVLAQPFVEGYSKLVAPIANALHDELISAVSKIMDMDPWGGSLQWEWQRAIARLRDFRMVIPVTAIGADPSELTILWELLDRSSQLCRWHAHQAWMRKLAQTPGVTVAVRDEIMAMLIALEYAPTQDAYAQLEPRVAATLGNYGLAKWWDGTSNGSTAGWGPTSRWAGMACNATVSGARVQHECAARCCSAA